MAYRIESRGNQQKEPSRTEQHLRLYQLITRCEKYTAADIIEPLWKRKTTTRTEPNRTEQIFSVYLCVRVWFFWLHDGFHIILVLTSISHLPIANAFGTLFFFPGHIARFRWLIKIVCVCVFRFILCSRIPHYKHCYNVQWLCPAGNAFLNVSSVDCRQFHMLSAFLCFVLRDYVIICLYIYGGLFFPSPSPSLVYERLLHSYADVPFRMNGRECDNILCIHIKPWSKEAKTEMEWRKREMESREMKNRNIISTIDFCSVLHLLSLSRWGLLSTFYRVCLCCSSLSCTTYVIPFSSSFSANICWLCVSLLGLLATTLVVWSVSCTVFISKCEYVRVFVCVCVFCDKKRRIIQILATLALHTNYVL